MDQCCFAAVCQKRLKSQLKEKYQCVFEGVVKAGDPTLLQQIYTELYITEGGTGEVNHEHEVRQIEAASRRPDRAETTIRQEDVLKIPPGRDEPIRTVMTKGVAGIGKTVLTQKFTLDWAEGRANQDIRFMFPFTFRELNVLKERKFSLVELVHHFFTETKEICSFEDFQVVFIFDGLDECRLPLDFLNNEILTDVTESTSVDVLLTNLIRGNLLPSARLWITTRPAAANQIPPECVSMVTEVRGFTNPQKEEYFSKRFRDEEQTSRIISHIKTSRSLHIMCHIPVFCWITATVLETVLETREGGGLPKTLTEMYIHFLVVQTKLKKVKYDGGAETDPHWSPESRKMMESLGKLAFEQLQKGNLIFYEEDLRECGIDIREASVYSGVFTQIFKEEKHLYQHKVFCFIHLSVQEFLAALHVHRTFINSGVNLLEEKKKTDGSDGWFTASKETLLYQTAVDKALQSPNGHLDLFLRFLLGLSLETNQTLLRGLLKPKQGSSQNNQETVGYIKKKISEDLSAEKSINLFHCLNEMNEGSLVEEVQQSLRSGRLSRDELSPAQWSALVFILLSSEEDLEVFDLKKYSASDKVLLRLLPVVKASKKVLLSGCNLSEEVCAGLSSVLSSHSSSLTELDLSNNHLQDSGLKKLCPGLESPHCQLESLRLSGCLLTSDGCASLVSALSSNPSHLRELDLSYNHPGESAVKLLSAGLEDPRWRLDTLRVEPAGPRWLRPGLRKYSCQLSIDTNTVNKHIKLSDNNRKMTCVKEDQSYPDHPDRFDYWDQLLCREVLTGRCYWEVQRSGDVEISITACTQKEGEEVNNYLLCLQSIHDDYSGMTKPDPYSGPIMTPYESHLKQSFLDGLLTPLSVMTKDSCIGVIKANDDYRAGLEAELEAQTEDDGKQPVVDEEQDANLKKVTNDCEQRFDQVKSIVQTNVWTRYVRDVLEAAFEESEKACKYAYSIPVESINCEVHEVHLTTVEKFIKAISAWESWISSSEGASFRQESKDIREAFVDLEMKKAEFEYGELMENHRLLM
ncbi:LOW QUALITY PROTEIN: protein NLRC3-like [Xenentodon cancila]